MNPYAFMLITWHDKEGNTIISSEVRNEQEAIDEMRIIRNVLRKRVSNKSMD